MIEHTRLGVLAAAVLLLAAAPGWAQTPADSTATDSTTTESTVTDSTVRDSTPADSIAQGATGPDSATRSDATGASNARAQSSGASTPGSADQQGGRGFGFHLPIGFSGQASVVGEMYGHSGVQARRPANAWRTSIAAQAVLFGQIRLGVDVLVSTAGAQVRQNINQFGLNPSWSWGTLHLGDFSRSYSSLTIQGVRIRGAGIDLRPGIFRFSIQGGRVQRTVSAGADGSAYRRNLVAAKLGLGRETGTFLDLDVVKAKDDIHSLEQSLFVVDSILVDTIPEGLRPQVGTRPQENLTTGLNGQLMLLDRRLVLKGEAAVALITRDLLAPEVGSGGGAVSLLSKVQPIRLSTSGDYSYKVDGTLSLQRGSVRGGYEYIGPGYTSLGLPYLINDRQSYHAGGNVRMLGNRLSLQGQVRHQTNNLASQKRGTITRNTANASTVVQLGSRATAMLSGMLNTIVGDASSDTFAVNSRSTALNAMTSLRGHLVGLPTVLSVTVGFQHTTDSNPIRPAPAVSAENVTTALQFQITPAISLAPSISGVFTSFSGANAPDGQTNIYAGLGSRGHFLHGRLRTAANFSRTFSNGREVTSGSAQVGYPVLWDATLSLRARYNNYTAYGMRPAFHESFITMTLTRSF